MNKLSIPKNLLVALLFASLAAGTLPAQTAALTSPGSGSASSASQAIGYTFTLSSPQSLDSLGLYDTGLSVTTQEVGIWNASGTLLASADVDVTAAGTGSFVYSTAITDSMGFTGTLSASTDYTIGTYGSAGLLYDSSAPTTSSAISLVYGNYSAASGAFEDPTSGSGTYYVGPNFTYGTATTPEPSTWALVLGGLGLLAFVVRRRSGSVR